MDKCKHKHRDKDIHRDMSEGKGKGKDSHTPAPSVMLTSRPQRPITSISQYVFIATFANSALADARSLITLPSFKPIWKNTTCSVSHAIGLPHQPLDSDNTMYLGILCAWHVAIIS